MNLLIVTGMVRGEVHYNEDDFQGPRCNFVLSPSIDRKAGDRRWWMLCTIQGKKSDEYVDRIYDGRMVTVHGQISCVGEERREQAPLSVRVKEVVFHDDELESDAA